MVTTAEQLLTVVTTTNGTRLRPEFRHSAKLSLRFKRLAPSGIIDSSVRKFQNCASTAEFRGIGSVFSACLTFRRIGNNNLAWEFFM